MANSRRMAIIMINLFILSNILAIIDIPFLEPLGSDGTADAAIITVDDSGGQDHATIQAAIDAASPGDTIRVHNGTYNESVIVNKTVTLIGNGSANTIIDGGGNGQSILDITANRVNISGFNVRHTGIMGRSLAAGISIYGGDNCKIENNNCSYNAMGIVLENTTNNTIANNTMIYNYWGVNLDSSSNNTIRNNSFTSNFFGIYLNASNNNLIINNTLDSNDYNGTPINPPDHDGNGLSDEDDGQNPWADSDHDGFANADEGEGGGYGFTDPFDADSDWDGLADGLDFFLGFWSADWDTDSDGISDRNEIQNFGIGTELSAGNLIENNTCVKYDNGILLLSSNNNTVDRCNTSYNNYGTHINSGNYNIITNGTMSYNSKGIYVESGIRNSLSNDIISTNGFGIYIESGNNNTASKENISNNAIGIMLVLSVYNDIYNNTLIANNFLAPHPAYWDTNGNGVPDNQEDPYQNMSADSDGDGLTNGEEMELGGWNPTDPDMDDDGLTDGLEAAFNLNPYNSDSDNNGIDDVIEYNNRHISLAMSDNNNITNNHCVNSTEGIFLLNSSLNSIISNIVDSSTLYGVTIYSGINNTIFGNQFVKNNNGSVQANDNGTGNFWNKTAGKAVGTGNFWSDYMQQYPSSSNDGIVWNTPYVINGTAGSHDNSPLFLPPGVSDNSLGSGTTGDQFTFQIEFPDAVEVSTFRANYSHGIETGNLSLVDTGGIWTGNIVLDHNLTNLNYTLYINSNNSYNFTISEKTVVVRDNDHPSLIDDSSGDNSTTGDEFIFNISASDNIEVGAVYAGWGHGGLSGNESLKLTNGYWLGTVSLDDALEDLAYTIFINDTSNNYFTVAQQDIPVADNDLPVIDADNSPNAGTTGDSFQFNISASDNIEIDTVFVDWAHGNLSGNESMSQSNGFWMASIQLDENNENLTYTVHVNDTSNNYNKRSPEFAVISDDEVPVLINDSSSDTGTTGDLFHFNVSASDNIDVGSIYINWSHGGLSGNKSLRRMDGYWVGNITLDHSLDNLSYIIYVEDSSGNYNISSTRTVTLADNDKPSFTDNTVSKGTTGEVFLFNVSAQDNIDVFSVNIIWNHGLLSDNLSLVNVNGFWGGSIVVDHNTAGLTYSTMVNDRTGNFVIGQLRTVTVTDNDIPIVHAGKDVVVEENGTVIFDANASDNSGIANYTWSFVYDNRSVVLYGPNPQFKFEEPGNYTVDLNVTDASGNVNSTQITVTVLPRNIPVEIDREPPVIIHNPKTEVNIFQNITITAVITDNVEVMSATLFYKNVGDANYSSKIMMPTGSIDSYYAIIPAQNQLGNVSYYIYATDGRGEATLPQNISRSVFTITVTEEEGLKEELKINILTPKKGATVKGKITINVSTVNGYIGDEYVNIVMVKVEVRESSTHKLIAEFSKINADNSSNKWFTFTWNTSETDDGKYTIIAEGYPAEEGNETVDEPVVTTEIGVTVDNPISMIGAVAGTVVGVAAAVGATIITSGAAAGAISAGGASTSGSFFGKLLGYLDKVLDPLQKKAERALEERTGKDATEFSIASPIITQKQVISLIIAIFALLIPLTYFQVEGGFFFTWGGNSSFSWSEYLWALPSVFLTAAIFLIALSLAEVYAVRLRKQWTEFKVWGVGLFSLFVSSFFFLIPFGMSGRLDQGYWERIDKKGFGFVGLARYFIILTLTLLFFLMILGGLKTAGEAGMLISLMTLFYGMMPFGESPGKYIFKWRKSVWIISGIFSAILFYGWLLELIPRMVYFIFGIIGLIGAGLVYIMLMKESRTLKEEKERTLRTIATKYVDEDDEDDEEEDSEEKEEGEEGEDEPVIKEETIEGDDEDTGDDDEEKGKDEDDTDVWDTDELPAPVDEVGVPEPGEPPAPPEDDDEGGKSGIEEEPELQEPPEDDDVALDEPKEPVEPADSDDFLSLDDDAESEEPATTIETEEADEFASLDDTELEEPAAPVEIEEPDEMELDIPPVPPD